MDYATKNYNILSESGSDDSPLQKAWDAVEVKYGSFSVGGEIDELVSELINPPL